MIIETSQAKTIHDRQTNPTNRLLRQEEEEKQEESTQIPSIPLTMREQQALKQIENLKQQPILIPATLRDDLVAMQHILEKNGKNPELLEEVKKDIEFFDTEVVKHVSE